MVDRYARWGPQVIPLYEENNTYVGYVRTAAAPAAPVAAPADLCPWQGFRGPAWP